MAGFVQSAPLGLGGAQLRLPSPPLKSSNKNASRLRAAAGAQDTRQQQPGYRSLDTTPLRSAGRNVVQESQQQLRPAPAAPTWLSFSKQVRAKDVVTRLEGNRLGTIADAFVDPVYFELVSMGLRYKEGVRNVPLSAIRQVGDVLLVHSRAALQDPSTVLQDGLLRLLGARVRRQNSTECAGVVRDFVFDPEDGTVCSLIYDSWRLPGYFPNLFDEYSVSVEEVASVNRSSEEIVLMAGAAPRLEKRGILGQFSEALRSVGLTDDMEEVAMNSRLGEWESEIRAWEQQTGFSFEEYQARYGQRSAGAGGQREGARSQGRERASVRQPERRPLGPPRRSAGEEGGYAQRARPPPGAVRGEQWAPQFREPPGDPGWGPAPRSAPPPQRAGIADGAGPGPSGAQDRGGGRGPPVTEAGRRDDGKRFEDWAVADDRQRDYELAEGPDVPRQAPQRRREPEVDWSGGP